jgi:gamma-glutamyltranspeptidase
LLLPSYHPGGNNFLTFREWLNPKTDHVYEVGDIIKRPILADTLEKLANSPDPVQLFYNSEMTDEMVREIQENGKT